MIRSINKSIYQLVNIKTYLKLYYNLDKYNSKKIIIKNKLP